MKLAALILTIYTIINYNGRVKRNRPNGDIAMRAPTTLAKQIIALLPKKTQMLIKIDLKQLRTNPTINPITTTTLTKLNTDTKLPNLPIDIQNSPLTKADIMILTAYNIDTHQTTTITILTTKAEIDDTIQLGPNLITLNPPK